MKISLITVVYNAKDTIRDCIESVIRQSHPDLEYIIVDGGSTDGTLRVIGEYRDRIQVLVSEQDQGIYDAMNKGIRLATGEIVGTLNADDMLADRDVISSVTRAFKEENTDIVYGNLHFIAADGRVTRRWLSGKCGKNSFNGGFMPPHPTFYCRRVLFEKFGIYSLEYGSAADYELMLRFMYVKAASSFHLNKVLVLMRTGGVSNSSFKNRLKAWKYDLKAMQGSHIRMPLLALVLKPLRKLGQFF